jgi:hypothetical protein
MFLVTIPNAYGHSGGTASGVKTVKEFKTWTDLKTWLLTYAGAIGNINVYKAEQVSISIEPELKDEKGTRLL